ncbi:hypothetical protein [Paracoccus sp. (in: a-proteobacteria)]|uniref:hypothetical protein n=1 Tax=Paracoccus sp. TaxID=267 RepID=UPI00321FFBC9
MARAFGCLALLLSLLSAGGAAANPWPRAEGKGFVSLSAEGDRDGNSYVALYGEYGLGARDTLGAELGRSSGRETSLMFWWQRALDDGQGPDRLALSLGTGLLARDGEYLPMLQIAAGWGRGFDALPLVEHIPGGGWLSAEARLSVAGAMKDQAELHDLVASDAGLLSYLTPETSAKAELTLGWHATESLMLINQFRFEERDDTGFASKLSISAVHDLPGPVSLEAGLVAPLSGTGETALKIGTWLEF